MPKRTLARHWVPAAVRENGPTLIPRRQSGANRAAPNVTLIGIINYISARAPRRIPVRKSDMWQNPDGKWTESCLLLPAMFHLTRPQPSLLSPINIKRGRGERKGWWEGGKESPRLATPNKGDKRDDWGRVIHFMFFIYCRFIVSKLKLCEIYIDIHPPD